MVYLYSDNIYAKRNTRVNEIMNALLADVYEAFSEWGEVEYMYRNYESYFFLISLKGGLKINKRGSELPMDKIPLEIHNAKIRRTPFHICHGWSRTLIGGRHNIMYCNNKMITVKMKFFVSMEDICLNGIPSNMHFEGSTVKLAPVTNSGVSLRNYDSVSLENAKEIFLDWIKKSGMQLCDRGIFFPPGFDCFEGSIEDVNSIFCKGGFEVIETSNPRVKPAKRDEKVDEPKNKFL